MKSEFTITSEYDGKRLDGVLAALMEDLSRSRIQKLFVEECILVNGRVCTSKKYMAAKGDSIEVILRETDIKKDDIVSTPKGEDIPLDIVFEDENYLVINKQKGLVVHPGSGNETGTLVNGLIHRYGDEFIEELKDVCDLERPGVVHRIDKDTTGLLVVAKTKAAFLDLSEQFKNHSITRRYTAIVYNNIKEDQGRIDLPIGRDPRNRLRRKVNGVESKEAITNYSVIERLGNYNLIEAILETGRTHQIRVHMAHIGHPVLGDPVYGPRKSFPGAEGQMLHAGELGFLMLNGEYIEFKREVPDSFQKVLSKIRKMISR